MRQLAVCYDLSRGTRNAISLGTIRFRSRAVATRPDRAGLDRRLLFFVTSPRSGCASNGREFRRIVRICYGLRDFLAAILFYLDRRALDPLARWRLGWNRWVLLADLGHSRQQRRPGSLRDAQLVCCNLFLFVVV